MLEKTKFFLLYLHVGTIAKLLAKFASGSRVRLAVPCALIKPYITLTNFILARCTYFQIVSETIFNEWIETVRSALIKIRRI